MSGSTALNSTVRRTASDDVFDQLHADIVTLRLLPGSRLSESDIAKQSDVSRQPVREAFIRLSNMGLLMVRPQKATVVRKISNRQILNARFIRTAVEIEVIRKACVSATDADFKQLELNVKAQKRAVRKNDTETFHALDYEFHRLICVAADCEFAFDAIAENKSQVDRLCMLCLADKEGMLELIDDHSQIFEALRLRCAETMISLTRSHLSRLDGTLKMAHAEFGSYFED
ncbi:MAG: GntR family transcriptional regulator [Granulosicoccus sp.]